VTDEPTPWFEREEPGEEPSPDAEPDPEKPDPEKVEDPFERDTIRYESTHAAASFASLSDDAQDAAQIALRAARDHLLSLQDAAGWWRGELQTNVTVDAEDLLLREFLSIRREDESERSAAWIRSQQREDGTWTNFYGGPGELSTTIEAYWALRLCGDAPEAAHMRRAAEFIREQGGLEQARVFTHIWLALFGLWSWERVPALPPEMILLPSAGPLNVYDVACWARQTIVALSIVKAHRPVRALPFDLAELYAQTKPGAEAPRGVRPSRLDRLLRAYERRPFAPLRRLALVRAEEWVVRRQEADGSWGGIQPPWVYSLMALHLTGYPLEHPVMRRGLEGLERFIVEDRGEPPSRHLEAQQSPVWDTALAMIALRDAGVEPEHPSIHLATEWLLGEDVRVRGDWAIKRPRLEPGGWTRDFVNVNYPDIDCTAEAVIALLRVAGSRRKHSQSIDDTLARALRWVHGMQSSGGGWGAFDADNTRSLVRKIPFLDFGEVIDEPSADVTAHTVEMLGALGLADEPAARNGVRWLIAQQEPDGSWFGRWSINHVYGTGAVVPGLIAAGLHPREPCIRRAIMWLTTHQNDDGGWGEDPRSYGDVNWIGHGQSTASQTAWALLALHAAGERSSSLLRGVAWLVRNQQQDGTWDEPQYTNRGPFGDYRISSLYSLSFPIMALSRCLAPVVADRDHDPQLIGGAV
jgi:squalene-hopene/tetraprenyl-beta-curcumene cyclase